MTVAFGFEANLSSTSKFSFSFDSETRCCRSSKQSRCKPQSTSCQISAVPEDVARLVGRVKKTDSPVKRQRNAVTQRHKSQSLNDSELLYFERKGHLLTRALIDPTSVHKLAEVAL